MRLALLFLAGLAFAQQAADPITDRMRYEIAAAQRDYLLTKQQFDQAAAQLKAKVAAAEKACSDQGKAFSVDAMSCEAKKESK